MKPVSSAMQEYRYISVPFCQNVTLDDLHWLLRPLLVSVLASFWKNISCEGLSGPSPFLMTGELKYWEINVAQHRIQGVIENEVTFFFFEKKELNHVHTFSG